MHQLIFIFAAISNDFLIVQFGTQRITVDGYHVLCVIWHARIDQQNFICSISNAKLLVIISV